MNEGKQSVWFDLNAALLKIALYAGREQDSQEDLMLDRLAITVGQLHDRMNPMGVSYPDPEEPVKSSFSESLEPVRVLAGTGLVSPRNTRPGHHDIQPG